MAGLVPAIYVLAAFSGRPVSKPGVRFTVDAIPTEAHSAENRDVVTSISGSRFKSVTSLPRRWGLAVARGY